MIKAIGILLLAGPAVFWIASVLWAQSQCSIIGTQCHGPDGDVWVLPLFLTPIGLPAVVISVFLIVRAS